jgi:ribosome-binding factor A
MSDEKQQELCLHGLRSAAGFLQQKVGNRIDTRYTPRLKFVLDQGIKKAAEVSRILGEILHENSDSNHPPESDKPQVADERSEHDS